MTEETAIATTSTGALHRTTSYAMPVMTIEEALDRRQTLIRLVNSELLKDGFHYGYQPGLSDDAKKKPEVKKVLRKEGAEVLANFFGLVPSYELLHTIVDIDGDEHHGEPTFHYVIKCVLKRNGEIVGEGLGSCSSRETKYRYRNEDRKCPECNQATIKKSKFAPKGRPNEEPGFYSAAAG
jgi:hypothetical protein